MSKNVLRTAGHFGPRRTTTIHLRDADTRLSPPSPAGPLLIPYPNTAKAADTTDGSKTVKIGGGEVGTKTRPARRVWATRPPGTLGGVVTHTIEAS